MKERRETSFRLIDKYATYMPRKSWEAGKIGGRAAKKLIADRQNNRGSAFFSKILNEAPRRKRTGYKKS